MEREVAGYESESAQFNVADTQAPKPAKPEAVRLPVYIQYGDVLYQANLDISFLGVPFQKIQIRLPNDGDKERQTELLELKPVNLELQNKMVEQLLIEGRVTKTIRIGNLIEVELVTKSTEESLEADLLPEGFEIPKNASQRWIANFNAVRTLALSIKSYAGKPIGESRADKEAFVRRLPEVVTDRLAGEYNQLLGELRHLLQPQVIAPAIKNF